MAARPAGDTHGADDRASTRVSTLPMPRLRTLASVAPVVIVHLALPLIFAYAVWRSAASGIANWLPAVYLALTFGAFIYLAGAWSWFGHAVRLLLAGVTVGAAVAGARRSVASPLMSLDVIDLIVRGGVGTMFLIATVSAVRGRRVRGPALDLAFPLRGGTFVIGQGGSTTAVNYHADHPSQAWALDILKLNAAGIRANGLYPAELARYAIYEAEVVGPCDGVIASVEDGVPDRPPPECDEGRPAGNCLAIETETATVFLAHLKSGSILVQVGEQVRVGQSLARVGNSGNTTEPHLHVHAEAGKYAGQMMAGPGVPLRFGGRFLVRNDRITPSHATSADSAASPLKSVSAASGAEAESAETISNADHAKDAEDLRQE